MSDRLNLMAQEATKELSEELGFTEDVFTRRGGNGILETGTATGEWIIHFWYKDKYALDARFLLTDAAKDEEIKQAIISKLEPQARKLREEELGGKLEDFQ